jgi:hypothetical protein
MTFDAETPWLGVPLPSALMPALRRCFAGRGKRRALAPRCDRPGVSGAVAVGPAPAQITPAQAAAALVGGVALASLSACATAQTYGPPTLPADQSAQVAQLCRTVIRVEPGEEHYVGCVDSLTASLTSAAQARAMQRARNECLDKGLAPASPELAECVLGAADPRPGSAAQSSRSYFYASNDEVRRREQVSCARLGLEPEGATFSSCVADLAAALFAADMPQN